MSCIEATQKLRRTRRKVGYSSVWHTVIGGWGVAFVTSHSHSLVHSSLQLIICHYPGTMIEFIDYCIELTNVECSSGLYKVNWVLIMFDSYICLLVPATGYVCAPMRKRLWDCGGDSERCDRGWGCDIIFEWRHIESSKLDIIMAMLDMTCWQRKMIIRSHVGIMINVHVDLSSSVDCTTQPRAICSGVLRWCW